MKISLTDNRIVKKPKNGIIYSLFWVVEEKSTGKQWAMDFPEYILNYDKYMSLNKTVCVLE